MTADDINRHLAEQIVACMRGLPGSPQPAAVDLVGKRVVAIGLGSPDTHVSQDELARSPDRYSPIPTRDRIESLDHVDAFLQDYHPHERRWREAAAAARARVHSVVAWRGALDERHDAVQAFDAYMDSYHHVIARMLMHSAKRISLAAAGLDAHDGIARTGRVP